MTGPGNVHHTHHNCGVSRTRCGVRKDGHRHAPHHSPLPRKGKSAPDSTADALRRVMGYGHRNHAS